MSEKSELTYLKGSAREVRFDKGSILKLSFQIDQLKELANDRGWINLEVRQRRETDQYKNTHFVVLDEFKPDPNKQSKGGVTKKEEDDIPF